jgi:hypothetical protein
VNPDLYLCGWRVSSEISLPALAVWRGDDRVPDVRIRFGDVAGDFVGSKAGLARRVDDPNSCRFYVPGTGFFEVKSRGEVVVSMETGASLPDVRACISGAVAGLLCLVRGLLPLHAASVRMGNGAVCLAGRSGAGKSTLAAALAQRGYALLSDDVCAIDFRESGPVVLPSAQAVRLGEQSVHAVGLPGTGGEDIGVDRVKRLLRFTAPQTEPVPLAAVYQLRASGDGACTIEEKPGAGGLVLLQEEIFRYELARRLGLADRLFQASARLCSSAPVRVLSRRFTLESLQEAVGKLEALHCGSSAGHY